MVAFLTTDPFVQASPLCAAAAAAAACVDRRHIVNLSYPDERSI